MEDRDLISANLHKYSWLITTATVSVVIQCDPIGASWKGVFNAVIIVLYFIDPVHESGLA